MKIETTSTPMFANTVEEEVTIDYIKFTLTVDTKTISIDFGRGTVS